MEDRDRAWLVDLAWRRYGSQYNATGADAWFTNVVLKNPIQYYATRTANAFQISNLTTTPWQPRVYRADIVFICADHGKMWETLPLLRDSIAWARDRGAYAWRFETETEHDLGPVMKKLGVTELTPRYHLELVHA